jgi:hypothetical protein
MPPFRVIVIETDRPARTAIMMSFDRAPDIGSTVELPNGERVIVGHVVNDPDDKLGVVIAAPA